ncbi:MAG: hypothetical protein V2J42_07785 [Wenzhouxiangella sp.]|nr:hypothetical protein [Wenzhouxiangella sp.]
MKFKALMLIGTIMLALVMASANASNAPSAGGTRATLPGDITVTGTETTGDTGDCQRVDINVTGEVTGTNDLGGGNDQIRVTVWDDGVEVAFEIVTIPVGQTVTIDVDLSFEGVVGQSAPGVGVYIIDGPDMDFNNQVFDVDPFTPDQVAGDCRPVVDSIGVPVNNPAALGLLVMLMLALGLYAGFGVRRG